MFKKNVAVKPQGVLPPIRGHNSGAKLFDKFEAALRLVEDLSDDGVCTEGLYRKTVAKHEVIKMYVGLGGQDSLSIDPPEDGDPHLVSGVLKHAFGQLIKHARELLVLPDSEAPLKKAVEALGQSEPTAERRTLVRAVFSHFTPRAQVALKGVLDHLKRVASFSDFNKMLASNLAIGFLGPQLGSMVWSEPCDQLQHVKVGNEAATLLIEYSDSLSCAPRDESVPVVIRPMPQPAQRPVKSRLCAIQ